MGKIWRWQVWQWYVRFQILATYRISASHQPDRSVLRLDALRALEVAKAHAAAMAIANPLKSGSTLEI